MRMLLKVTNLFVILTLLVFGSANMAYAYDYFDGTYIWSFKRINSNTCAQLDCSGGARGVSYGIDHEDAGDAYADIIQKGEAPVGVISVPTTVCINTGGRTGDVDYPVTSLGEKVFSQCIGLTDIIIPNCISNVGASCFAGCIGLTTIRLPESVSSIGSFAFSGCSNLTSITLPQNLTQIGRGAFKNCTRLSAIELPSGVTAIPTEAFLGCVSLVNASLPSDLTAIGGKAFQNCSALRYIVIPESVTEVESYAFTGCTGLKKAFVPESLRGKLGLVKKKETAFDDFSVVEYYDSEVSQLVSSGEGSAIAVRKSWMDDKCGVFLAASAGNYETAAMADAANGLKVWECFVAGLDPTNANSRFTSTIEFENGFPIIRWEPNLNEDGNERIYTIYGRASLDDGDGWTTPTNSLHRFFKVGVEMP